jgi:hypothetical protein
VNPYCRLSRYARPLLPYGILQPLKLFATGLAHADWLREIRSALARIARRNRLGERLVLFDQRADDRDKLGYRGARVAVAIRDDLLRHLFDRQARKVQKTGVDLGCVARLVMMSTNPLVPFRA